MKSILSIFLFLLISTSVRAQVTVISSSQSMSSLPSNQVYVGQGGSVRLLPPSGGSLTISATGGAKLITTDASRLVLPSSQTRDMNYVKTTTARSASTNLTSLSASDKSIQYTYLDGLGRPVQQVMQGMSPQFMDLIQPMEYDSLGRQSKQYLPYVEASNDGAYKNDWKTRQPTFYSTSNGITNGKVARDTRPFSEVLFEASPLNRPEREFGAGNDWYTNQKGITHGYEINVHGTGANQERIIAWTLNSSGNPIRHAIVNGYVVSGGYYTSGQLQIKSTKDENGNAVREYTDKLGRMILKKVQDATSAAINNETHWAQTYYVYDDFGNLRYVFPPALTELMVANTTNVPSAAQLNLWAFQYKYDERQRMISKKVPGAGWVEMVYDRWDRLVLSQDANQAAKSPKEYTFTKYDALNRPIMSGLWTNTTAIGTLRTQAMAHLVRHENKVSGSLGYTLNLSFPSTGITQDNILSLTYYDDYTTPNNWAGLSAFVPELGNTSHNQHVKGQVTGSQTQILGSSPRQWLKSVTYYDDKYRPIQSITENHMGGTDRVSSKYDFIGQVLETQRNHTATGQPSLLIKERFVYDHAGRLKQHYHALNGQAEVLLAEHRYNELGELVEKNLHSENGGSTNLQSVDYRYNIRGWLTSINNQTLTNQAGVNDDTNDLFGMELFYNARPSGIDPALAINYNGNITAVKWGGISNLGTKEYQGYSFAYDKMNRLTDALHHTGTSTLAATGKFGEYGISYDKNGNIMTLKRRAENPSNDVDNLIYNYTNSGNQLLSVTDQAATAYKEQLFKDGTNSGNDYTYDANGNMKTDLNKGISQINYNYLNLPQTVNINGATVNYTYDAQGQKLKKTAGITTTDYIGGIHYENNSVTFMQTAEGRLRKDGTAWVYEYNLTDHLGNVRVSFDKNPSTGLARLIQKDDYYPFGLTFNSYTTSPENLYKYNGFEEQKEVGWYDYLARQYDPTIGRFLSVDPAADLMRRISPYAYAFNNPIRFTDPDGMVPGDFLNEKGENIGNDGRNDGKVYVVKTTQSEFDSGVPSAGITKDEAKQTEAYIKANSGNTEAFGEGNIANANSVEIEGSSATRQGMVDIVNQDNGKGGTKDANNREYGGEISVRGEVTASAPGPVSDPSKGGADVTHSTYGDDTRTTFHSHPSGVKSVTTGGGPNTIGGATTTTSAFRQAPSDHDVSTAGSSSEYVFGRGTGGGGTVYIYNNQGVQATVPQKYFVNPKTPK